MYLGVLRIIYEQCNESLNEIGQGDKHVKLD